MAINKMLLPMAITPRSERMLAYATGLAVQGVQNLIVAHVVDSSGQEAPVILAEVGRAREKLRELVAPFTDCGMHIEVRVVTGSVFRGIMALANESDIDVILCGTEGKSFVDYLFAGSVSEDIALKGDERTMTVRYDLLESVEQSCQLARDFARRLVVPSDFSSSSLRAVLSAMERPADALGVLHVVHVASDGAARAEAEMQMRTVNALAEEHGCEVVISILEGDPATELLGYLERVDATGVITGRRGKSRLTRGLLGSTSMRLLQEAPCPVVIQP